MNIAVVVMFLNEERHLATMLTSLEQQTRPPDQVLLVDDGSTDGSADIAAAFSSHFAHARLLRRPPRPPERDRLLTASVWKSFQWAVDQLDGPVDVVAKVDADLDLAPDVLQTVETMFAGDSGLGVTGPFISERSSDGTLVRLRWRPEHVAGATKFYRWSCYQEILPVPAVPNWDMIDVAKARASGWRTASFETPSRETIHLRPAGTYDGSLRGFRRWGTSEFVSGTHPISVAYVGLQRVRDRPIVLGTLNYYWGWLSAAARRQPRVERDIRTIRRRELHQRVRARLGGLRRRPRRSRT